MMALLLRRRFLPFFICQFLGALNDSVFRLALIAMLSFGVLRVDNSGVFIQLSAALFMLPFFLFSAGAGDYADKIGKRRMLRLTKACELLIMTFAAFAVHAKSLPLILTALFLTGAQSAFFGPVKYALLPMLLPRRELLSGNAWFGVSTFAGILLGTLLGTAGGRAEEYALALSGGFVLLSAGGLAAAWLVPPAPGDAAHDGWPAFRPLRAYREVMKSARADRPIFHRIIAGSWFWLLGALLLGELPQLGEAAYFALLQAVLAGVCAGAVFCRLLLRDEITTKYAPLALLIGGVLLFDISTHFTGEASWRLLLPVAAFTAAMTVYVVPVRASLQALAADETRARVIGAYNIYNSLFIVVAALLAALTHAVMADGASAAIMRVACLLSLAGVLPACLLLPLETFRRLLRVVCRCLFRVQVRGEEHLNSGRAAVICNHVSYLDAFLISVFLENKERRMCFAIDVAQSQRVFVRPFLNLVTSFPLDPTEPHSIRRMIKEVRRDARLRPMIFPEGRLTPDGGLMKVYSGAGVIAAKASGGEVLPVHISGVEFSSTSRLAGKRRLRWFPRIVIHVFPPRKIIADGEGGDGQRGRAAAADRISALMEECAFKARGAANLTTAFMRGMADHGGGAPLFSELPDRDLTRRHVCRAAVALGETVAAAQGESKRIGVLLPTSVGAAALFYGAMFYRLTPVMLNPSAGKRQVLSACRTAQVTTVYTSARLLEAAPSAADIAAALADAGMRVVKLESLRDNIAWQTKLRAVLYSLMPARMLPRLPGAGADADAPACVLFTSGSEGAPKGVVLSHRNLFCNGAQILSRLSVGADDVMLNALPVFHSFGLVAGLIVPVIGGCQALQYPSPLHYRLIPEIVYLRNVTVFFSADTFLANYGKYAHPMDFQSLRLVFAGAEKLKETTRRLWADKFGVRILEGYGVTETSPALSFNSPAHCRFGGVGRLLPGIEARLQPAEGVKRGGRLFVRGVNVMRGYFLADAPGVLRPPPDGWHDTGDIADIDADGYLFILGRAKRFVKIAGEMAPLDGIEQRLAARWPEAQFAVVGVGDEKRGEALALMTTAAITRDDIIAAFRADGLPELWAPRVIKTAAALPLLPTGKTDYPAVAEAMRAAA